MSEALIKEKQLVNEEWVNRKDNYNCAIGGKGSPIHWMNDEQKKRRVENIKKGVNENLHKVMGEKNQFYGKASVNRRAVIKYDKLGVEVGEYPSILHASRESNLDTRSVGKCCRGESLHSGGFVFKYKTYSIEEQEKFDRSFGDLKRRLDGREAKSKIIKIKKERTFNRISVMVYNGEDFMGEFPSLKEAANYIGVSRACVGLNLRDKFKNSKGYTFKRKSAS